MGQMIGGHAVVLDGSMGGLLAARALAEHYDRVSIVERDPFPPDGAHRKGVPQARHAHGLLARGREVLEELFPGLTDDLIARGALTGDIGARCAGSTTAAITGSSTVACWAWW